MDNLQDISEGKWKSGDVVRLKAGGPDMTVDRYVEAWIPTHNASTGNIMDSMCGSAMKPDGEAVRCVYISKLSDGTWGFHLCTIEVSADALMKVGE